jgi:hypothetical protein
MNERIQQLWSQAEEEIKAEYEDESRRNRRLYNEIFLPKFAELIVQECIDIIAPYSVRMSRPGEEYLHPILEIKQHFGVEE